MKVSVVVFLVFEDTLKRDLNTEAITKKGHQRLHLLRKLRSFNVDPTVFKLFYNYFIESVLAFSFICWFYHFNVKQRNLLQRTVKFLLPNNLWPSRKFVSVVRPSNVAQRSIGSEGPRACPVRGVRTPAPWTSLLIVGMQNKQKR